NSLFTMVAQGNEKNGKVYTIPTKSAVQKTTETQKKFWHIDREMLRFKLHFFLFMGGLGSLVPYITIFAKNRIHISASSMASILTTQQFLFIFTKPVIGYIADYFNKLKAIICILTIVQTVFFFLLLAIPKIQKEDKQAIQSNNTHLSNSYEYLKLSHLFVNCPSNGDDNPFSETVLYFRSREEIEFCFLSLNYLSKLSDECSKQDLEARNVSEIRIPKNDTENSLFPKGEANTSLSISLYTNFSSSCKVCCKSTRKCQNIECQIPRDNRK
ncbi:hypothetical protein AVEN_167755-1, partial [Araneus ventricosus]